MPDDEATSPEPIPEPDNPEPAVPVDLASNPKIEEAEEAAIRLGAHWRRRRFLYSVIVLFAAWFLMIALIHAGTDPIVYLVLLVPLWLLSLPFFLRTPKALRKPKAKKRLADRLNFTNRLTLAIVVFICVYLPFTFISNKVIPYAPVVEFFTFAAVLFILYRIAGRSVGVAPSVEALPPASHRLHKQVVLAIDDPHYQNTLFLNFEFVDKGRGGKTLAKRLQNAMAQSGVDDERSYRIVEDLEDYREGFHLGFALTRRGRDKRRTSRDRRSQVLRSVYTKFNQELEQTA